MSEFNKIVGRLWLYINYLLGVAVTALFFCLTLILALVLLLDVLGVSGFPHLHPWYVGPVLASFAFFGFAYLNILVFFSRLKQVNSELYYRITAGWPAIAYISSSQLRLDS